MRPTKRNITLALLAAGAVAVTVFLWRAKATTIILEGYDPFSTPANALTQESLSLPPGALTDSTGSLSEAFNGQVTYQGGAVVAGYTGDTVIERIQNVTIPGSTRLVVIGINLVSVGTIPITFQDGSSANYSVSVSQSPSTQSNGTMTFASNGTFTSTLSINVQYTFSATGEPTIKFDAGPHGLPSIALSSAGTWQSTGNGGVIIHPDTEQGLLASHNVLPAPSPKPTATEPAQ
jgi:hypothetical protein